MTDACVHECHRMPKGRMRINAALRGDPSRTTMIRAAFVRQVNKLFGELKRDLRRSIVDEDCFGLQPDVPRTLSPTRRKQFEFVRTPEKVQQFMSWLEEQEAAGVLKTVRRPGVYPGIEAPWSDVYIDSAYQRGIRNGRARLRKAGWQVPSLEAVPGGVGALMNQPIHADRVGVIYSRTYEDLKSVTQVMNAQIRRKISEGLTTGLARGIAEGKNPRTIARELFKDTANRVDKIGIVRARMIARTEVINAHNEAQMAEYEMAEQAIGKELWVDVSNGANPCPICVDLAAGGPYQRTRAIGQLPAHPNCVCAHIPVPPGEKK
jgi:hypothetical protein